MTYVTHAQLTESLLAFYDHILERMQAMADATQADIDNLTSQVQQVATDLTDAQSKLQAEIDSLAGQGVDVTALQAAVAPLDTAVQALGNLQPTPPPAP
jgi:uncharacterized phage infection (PIP) family protein YhgE